MGQGAKAYSRQRQREQPAWLPWGSRPADAPPQPRFAAAHPALPPPHCHQAQAGSHTPPTSAGSGRSGIFWRVASRGMAWRAGRSWNASHFCRVPSGNLHSRRVCDSSGSSSSSDGSAKFASVTTKVINSCRLPQGAAICLRKPPPAHTAVHTAVPPATTTPTPTTHHPPPHTCMLMMTQVEVARPRLAPVTESVSTQSRCAASLPSAWNQVSTCTMSPLQQQLVVCRGGQPGRAGEAAALEQVHLWRRGPARGCASSSRSSGSTSERPALLPAPSPAHTHMHMHPPLFPPPPHTHTHAYTRPPHHTRPSHTPPAPHIHAPARVGLHLDLHAGHDEDEAAHGGVGGKALGAAPPHRHRVVARSLLQDVGHRHDGGALVGANLVAADPAQRGGQRAASSGEPPPGRGGGSIAARCVQPGDEPCCAALRLCLQARTGPASKRVHSPPCCHHSHAQTHLCHSTNARLSLSRRLAAGAGKTATAGVGRTAALVLVLAASCCCSTPVSAASATDACSRLGCPARLVKLAGWQQR